MDPGQRTASLKFLIRDRAGQFTSSSGAVFTAEGIRILASPPQASRANAICERITGTLRRELLDRVLIVNEHHLRQVLPESLGYSSYARPHRSLGRLPPPDRGLDRLHDHFALGLADVHLCCLLPALRWFRPCPGSAPPPPPGRPP